MVQLILIGHAEKLARLRQFSHSKSPLESQPAKGDAFLPGMSVAQTQSQKEPMKGSPDQGQCAGGVSYDQR